MAIPFFVGNNLQKKNKKIRARYSKVNSKLTETENQSWKFYYILIKDVVNYTVIL